MDFFALLRPLEWVVAHIMVAFHSAFMWLGLDSASGAAWALSIVGLVIVIRMLLIPLFVKQIKASRAMQIIAPELRKVQDKYKGKKDQASREAMSRETMELYAKHKTNPFASCLPILVQAPIFFALFRVLNYRLRPDVEVVEECTTGDPVAECAPENIETTVVETFNSFGWLTAELAEEANRATIFGAQLSETFLTSDGATVKIVASVLIAAMVATTFLTQRQLTRKNMPKAALEGPMAQQQKILLYALPFIFVISGPYFPIGVLIYWTTTNLWTMGQQFYVIRRNPTPGSEAEKALLARRAAKEAKKGIMPEIEDMPPPEPKGQREQPKRRKKRGRARRGSTT